ncbi:MAG: rod shape-determining protein MreD [Planctomycetes bacterium]|nr:rod shape-determining protein MreD [Planctomycetota bacterium]
MRWSSFAIIAVATLTAHTTLAPRLAVGGVWPDVILIVVVFFAMHARKWDAVIAAWSLGLLADLASLERFGLLSLTYALVAISVQSSRDWMFRSHPLTHAAVTFVSALVVHVVFWVYAGFSSGSVVGQPWASVGVPVGIALYTAICAPPVHAVLLRFLRWFGLDAPRYSHARLRRIGTRSTVL